MLLLVLEILIGLLLCVCIFLGYMVYKIGTFLFEIEKKLNNSIKNVDDAIVEITEVLEINVIEDTPEARKIIQAIINARTSLFLVIKEFYKEEDIEKLNDNNIKK